VRLGSPHRSASSVSGGCHLTSLSHSMMLKLSVFRRYQSAIWTRVLSSCFTLVMGLMIIAQPVWAGINDDRFDGNIFALYAGNGSLVPAKVTLAESRARSRVALLVFFLDDSKDCKQFVDTISQLQRYYGVAADFIPVNVDALTPESAKTALDPGYYYSGYVPQTVMINQAGDVVLDEVGQVSYEAIDDRFREAFDLLPRSESVELKRRSFNEFNSELVPSE
jgi:hypothetical protein